MALDYNDPKVVKELETRAKIAEKEDGIVTIQLMETIQGRAFTYRLLEQCHVFQSSFNTNALTMSFNEGNRNVGLIILSLIMRFCPDQYVLMMREANARSTSSEHTRSPNGNGRVEGSDLDGADYDDNSGTDKRRPVEDNLIDYDALNRQIVDEQRKQEGG